MHFTKNVNVVGALGTTKAIHALDHSLTKKVDQSADSSIFKAMELGWLKAITAAVAAAARLACPFRAAVVSATSPHIYSTFVSVLNVKFRQFLLYSTVGV